MNLVARSDRCVQMKNPFGNLNGTGIRAEYPLSCFNSTTMDKNHRAVTHSRPYSEFTRDHRP